MFIAQLFQAVLLTINVQTDGKFLHCRLIMNQNLMVCSSGTSIFGRQEFCFQAEPCHEKLLLIQDHFLSPVLAVRGAGGQSGGYVHSAALLQCFRWAGDH